MLDLRAHLWAIFYIVVSVAAIGGMVWVGTVYPRALAIIWMCIFGGGFYTMVYLFIKDELDDNDK